MLHDICSCIGVVWGVLLKLCLQEPRRAASPAPACERAWGEASNDNIRSNHNCTVPGVRRLIHACKSRDTCAARRAVRH